MQVSSTFTKFQKSDSAPPQALNGLLNVVASPGNIFNVALSPSLKQNMTPLKQTLALIHISHHLIFTIALACINILNMLNIKKECICQNNFQIRTS